MNALLWVQPPLAFKTADLRIFIDSRSLFAKRHGLLLGKPRYLKQQPSGKKKKFQDNTVW
jgi:hypothetical protein